MPPDDSSITKRAAEPPANVRELLEGQEEADVPHQAKTIESARRDHDASFEALPTEEVAHTQDFEITGPEQPISVRLYEPSGTGPRPILVYFHGGGWLFGNLDTHENIPAVLTNRAECLVLSVDYRLAPEHHFPAALEDAYAAVEWVDRHGESVGADTTRIAVGGDSSGGNIAAALALLTRERDGPALTHQLLLMPALNYAFDTNSYEQNAEGYVLSREFVRYAWEQYLGRDIHGYNPFASPLRAQDHSDLPTATIVTAGFDPVRDDGLAYGETLASDGVGVNQLHYEAMVHGFIYWPHMLDQADEALAEVASELRTAFEGEK